MLLLTDKELLCLVTFRLSMLILCASLFISSTTAIDRVFSVFFHSIIILKLEHPIMSEYKIDVCCRRLYSSSNTQIHINT